MLVVDDSGSKMSTSLFLNLSYSLNRFRRVDRFRSRTKLRSQVHESGPRTGKSRFFVQEYERRCNKIYH